MAAIATNLYFLVPLTAAAVFMAVVAYVSIEDAFRN